jgi:predicted dienelactone hydrolase
MDRKTWALAMIGFCALLSLCATQPLLPLFQRAFQASTFGVGLAAASGSPLEPNPGGPVYKVGMTLRKLVPSGDFPWRGSKEQALRVTIWYPATADASEVNIRVPSAAPMWEAGRAAVDAASATTARGFPLVVMSHGMGGAAVQLAWLGTALARRGFVAAAVNHPGNSVEDVNTFEGFILRWERARDLRAVIDGVLADKTIGNLIDARRIGAAGFSLGGFTVIEIAGGRTDMAGFLRYCAGHEDACAPPPEYHDLNQQVEARTRKDARFRAALERAGDSYRDERVRAIFAIAPPLGHSFARASLAAIAIPVQIVVGHGDQVAPAVGNAAYLADHIKGARLDVLPGAVGHFVFLDLPTPQAKSALPGLAVDPPGVDRAAIHDRVAGMAVEFFAKALQQ